MHAVRINHPNDDRNPCPNIQASSEMASNLITSMQPIFSSEAIANNVQRHPRGPLETCIAILLSVCLYYLQRTKGSGPGN